MGRPARGFLVPALLLLGWSAAHASTFRSVGPALYVNGVAVLRLTASAGSLDGPTRVEMLATRLSSEPQLQRVTTDVAGGEAAIFAGGSPCLTVTHEDAVRCGTTAQHLAAVWAQRINAALELPPLKLGARSMDVPIGADRAVLIVGSKSDQATVATSDAKILKVKRTDEGLELESIGVGTANVVVRAGEELQTVAVTVRPWAADFPQTVSGEVVGLPADGGTVRGAVATALRMRISAQSGAQFEYTLPDCGALDIGADRTYAVPVRAIAPGAYPNYGNVLVHIKNVPVPRHQDAELWYSNNPEVLSRPRALFSATLRPDEPARLLYHHINGTTQGLYLRIEAINSSDEPARIVIIPGDSRPNKNPVLAGIEAAAEYFRSWIVGSGEIVTIPAHASLPLCLRRLDPNQTASGLCGLRLLSGPRELLVRTDSLPPFSLDPSWRSAVASSTPWREVGSTAINEFDRAPYEISEHIYPDPHRTEQMSYLVGGRYGFLRIGQRAILRQDKETQLDGNFGVVYNIQATVQNPTKEPTDVEVVFEASAGYSGGLFLVDGNIMRTPLLQPKDETRLARYYLPPGATRRVDITTLPLAGSSYPATLLIRPLPHLIARELRTKKK
jgi:hypothetical protein